MSRIAKFTIIALLITGPCAAQLHQKQFNSLLWRISGNGMKAPSYLYGTMHLTDKRLFNFSDSLYYFLEHSEGYAGELDMGLMMPEIMSGINEEKDKTLIKDLVRMEWLKPFQKKLEKIVKKGIDKITVDDLSKTTAKLEGEIARTGEMATIMDVYLYDIARRSDKWVGGIEDFEDQRKPENNGTEDEIKSMISQITEDKTESNKKLEWMINTYLSQQLDTIDLTNEIWKGAERNILVRRNKKMSRRIDSIMQIRTCLFAVGAAHIPGDSGLVKLLRERGFNVAPVYSSKKIEAGKYVYKAREIPWVNADIKDNWYTLQMPGKAEEFQEAKEIGSFGAMMYYDLTRLNAYVTFGFPLVAGRHYDKDSLYKSLAQNFAKGGKVLSMKNISSNGIAGKEFLIKSDENDMRMQAFLPPAAIVLNIMSSNKHDSLFGNDASHFFSSFHLLKEAPAIQDNIPKTSIFRQQAFSINFPGPYYEAQRDLVGDSIWRTHVYISTNTREDISYCMMVMDATSGYYSDTDSSYFEMMKKNVMAKFKAEKEESSGRLVYHGFPSYEFHFKMKYSNEDLELKARMVNRGSRRYYAYVVYGADKSASPKVDSFLNSFEFLPLPKSSWSYHYAPAKDIAIWGPAALHYPKGEDSTKTTTGYILYDSVSPATVLINKEFLSNYSWWRNDSSFFREMSRRFIGDNDDSLRDYSLVTGGELPQADFLVIAKDNHNLKKVRLLLNGDTLYAVFAFLPPDLLQSPDYTRLFNAIRISKIKSPGYLLANKTDRILKDLVEGDSTGFENARDALDPAPFDAGDLPKLQAALLQPYRDFDTEHFGAHRKLADKIIGMDDGSTTGFIKKNYYGLKDSSAKLQYPLLRVLLQLKTKASFELFREIISNKLPAVGDAKILQYSLDDSLAFTADLLPTLLQLSADTGFIKILPIVIGELLDSNYASITQLNAYKNNFYGMAEREIGRLKREAPEYDYAANQLISLLARFKEPAAWQLLQKFLLIPGVSIKMNAATALAKNGQKINPAELEKIASDDYSRIELYESLKDLNKENLFPARYYTQRLMAQSDIFQAASDDNSPDSVTFIMEKTALFRGKQSRFLLFKVIYNYEGGEKGSYLGVTGPYTKTPGKIIARSDISGVYDQEEFDIKKIDTQFKAWLEQAEENGNENE